MTADSRSGEQSPSRRWRPRIRTLLLALALAVHLPLAALAVWLGLDGVRRANHAAAESVLATARLVAAGIDLEQTRIGIMLERLEARPEVQAIDLPRCRATFRELQSLSPGIVNIGITDTTGQALCLAIEPPGTPLPNFARRDWFPRALRSPGTFVAGPTIGDVSGRWVFLIGRPVRDARGRTIALVGVTLEGSKALGIFPHVRMPPGGAITIVSEDGAVIAHSQHPEAWVGRNVRGTPMTRLTGASTEGTGEGPGLDGTAQVFGFVVMPATGWRVYVGLPASQVHAAARDLARTSTTAAILMAILIVLLVAIASRAIERPVAALAAAASSAARGRLESRIPVRGPVELATVTEEFNTMIDHRARADREREDLLAREQESRTRAEAAGEDLRAMFDRVEDGFVSLDRQWRYVFVNRRAGEMFGRNPADLVGRHIWTEFPEGVGQPFQVAYERAFAEQRPEIIEDYYAPWDRWFENRIHPHAGGLEIFFTEITDRKRAERARQEAESRLRMTIEAANVGLWDWDLATNVVHFSAEWKRQLGYEPDEIPDRFEEWERRVHPDDLPATLARVHEYSAHPAGRFVLEQRMRHRDGSWRWILVHANMHLDAAGRPVRMLGCHIDVSEEKQAERERDRMRGELRRHELLAALGALVGGVAHEVRTPLFGITATLDAMERRCGTGGVQAEYVAKLRIEAGRLDQLMRDLLDFGRTADRERVAVRLRPVIEEAAGLAGGGTPLAVRLDIRVPDDLPELRADRDALTRAFRNLIQNALQHTPAGGAVTVEAAVERDTAGEWLACAVSDTGPGFREQDVARLGEPFFSRRPGGTGLGLSIVRRIVEDHDGVIAFGNHEGGGATVRMRLRLNRSTRSGHEPEGNNSNG